MYLAQKYLAEIQLKTKQAQHHADPTRQAPAQEDRDRAAQGRVTDV